MAREPSLSACEVKEEFLRIVNLDEYPRHSINEYYCVHCGSGEYDEDDTDCDGCGHTACVMLRQPIVRFDPLADNGPHETLWNHVWFVMVGMIYGSDVDAPCFIDLNEEQQIEYNKTIVEAMDLLVEHDRVDTDEDAHDAVPDIVFCCAACNKQIIRDSDDHDKCKCDETGQVWVCEDCDIPVAPS